MFCPYCGMELKGMDQTVCELCGMDIPIKDEINLEEKEPSSNLDSSSETIFRKLRKRRCC